MTKILLYQKDYTDKGLDRFVLWDHGRIAEVDSKVVVAEDNLLVCHDYWLIASSLYTLTGKLPKKVLDIEDFRISIAGEKIKRRVREQKTVIDSISDLCKEKSFLKKYMDIFNRKIEFDISIYEAIASNIEQHLQRLTRQAAVSDELQRYLNVELPVFNFLTLCVVKGIKIDSNNLRQHKASIEHKYYTLLKNFSAKYDLPLDIPSDEEICDYLEPKGFDFSGVSLDYVLKFVPMENNFAEDLIKLRKLAESRNVLTSIPVSRTRIYPIVDIFGSITSRIYYRDPSLQNLSKKHRNIIAPDSTKYELSYVDYDQFEVGIMAALSDDPVLKSLYNDNDLYLVVSNEIFGNAAMRKFSKRLFLSYAYGMKVKGLCDAAASHGAQREKVKEFFKKFSVFEEWKETNISKFIEANKIGTSLGNFLIKKDGEKVSEKEKRSCISQVVQGTASLIFKKALLQLCEESEVTVKIPMHDAVLVQHEPSYDKSRLPKIFSEVMTTHFNGAVIGKASLTSYFDA